MSLPRYLVLFVLFRPAGWGGVSELRIDVGAGYRVYYAMAGKQRTQNADIDRACSYWKNWRKEKSNE